MLTRTERIITQLPFASVSILAVIGALTCLFSWWGLAFIGLAAIELIACLDNILASPPHIGITTIWGQRKKDIKKEGFLLLFPWWPLFYDVVKVNVEKKNVDFQPKDVRTKEKAELEISISATYTPDEEAPENTLEYLNSGGKDGIKNILEDVLAEICREFAIDKSWEDCLANKNELAIQIVKEMTGVTGQAELGTLQKSLQQGNGAVKIPKLGIVINRLNVGTIWIKGRLAEAAEKMAVESMEKVAENVEGETVTGLVQKYIGLGLTPKQALDAVQTERGKVTKHIEEYIGLEGGSGGNDPLLKAMMTSVLGKGGGKKEEEKKKK